MLGCDPADFSPAYLRGILHPDDVESNALMLSGKQIAEQIGIAKNTADTHRRNLLRKTGAKNTLEPSALRVCRVRLSFMGTHVVSIYPNYIAGQSIDFDSFALGEGT